MSKAIALVLLIISFPLWPVLYFAVKLTSQGPFIFKQKRAGLGKKPFTMYKIRTMADNAEQLKTKYLKLNEADGPIFKIRNDPRLTRVGKLIAQKAIDELPQLVNVIRGEMALVGPRPLPISEANKVPKKYFKRFSVLPGMTSLWVIRGAHKIGFEQWMRLDLEYVQQKSVWYDTKILLRTFFLLAKAAGEAVIK